MVSLPMLSQTGKPDLLSKGRFLNFPPGESKSDLLSPNEKFKNAPTGCEQIHVCCHTAGTFFKLLPMGAHIRVPGVGTPGHEPGSSPGAHCLLGSEAMWLPSP